VQIREPHIWTRSSIQPSAAELRIAESLYRRALDVVPDDAEVLLRIGRVVGQLGRHQEAIALLTRAAARLTVAPLKYDGQLFLGREEQALGNVSRARAAFQEASRLFPRAQSPQLSLSQLSVLEGRPDNAEQALRSVFSAPQSDAVVDPWVDYAFSHLRDLRSLMRQVYAAVPAGSGS
jgi:tetratricopeptide (TPR) repeat protein